ncbi:hypothetical protein FOZ60_010339 [Perkinsus olseni]|uniref:Peptidase A1 domain-containing protein n=1 Tax=Perkinsus olseni TaxID=32597 RepID=A0A7J6PD20_PEROL|nr:hypothetical protein FOZ60_010339 [Perkinsus olseni]
MRLPIFLRAYEGEGHLETLIIAPIKADGQSLNLLVDTGCSEFFVIERGFLTRTRSSNACEQSIFGCYECASGHCETDAGEVRYGDGGHARYVQHRGTLELGGQVVPDCEFGLLVDYTPVSHTPHASLGLGSYPYEANTPIMKQLTDRGLVRRNDFSIYFKPDSKQEGVEEGELILGGEDPSKYRGHTLNARLTASPVNGWIVELEGLGVDGRLLPQSAFRLHVDSGTSRFWLPHDIFTTVLRTLEASATATSGRSIKFKEIRKNQFALPKCSDRTSLPPLDLYFLRQFNRREFSDKLDHEDWPIVIPPELYVHHFPKQKRCILMLIGNSEGSHAIGVSLLRNYYLYFQKGHRRIQFTRVAQSNDSAKLGKDEGAHGERDEEKAASENSGWWRNARFLALSGRVVIEDTAGDDSPHTASCRTTIWDDGQDSVSHCHSPIFNTSCIIHVITILFVVVKYCVDDPKLPIRLFYLFIRGAGHSLR